MEKICWQITVAAFMQPLQCDLWSPAAKDNSITHAAKRGSNTCNPIYIAGTILQLQSAMEIHRQLLHQHHLQCHLQWGKHPTVANHNAIPSTTHPAAPLAIPFTLREQSGSCKSQWNSVDHTCTKNTWHPIYNAEPIRECSEHDPPMIRPHTRPSRNRRTAEVDHRGSETDFVWKNIGFRASAISQKRISCETSSKTHRQLLHQHHLQCYLHCGKHPTVGNHNGIPSTTHPAAPLAIPFTLREQSCSCKSQWNSVDHTCTKNTWHPIYNAEPIREWSEHDPPMIRPHTRPSRNRRTAEVDHRGSETDFVWKNIGFRASAISQKRISCETSSKTPSATPPPAPLAMLFTLREASYSWKSQWNSIDNSSGSTTCNPIYIAGTILQLQITMEFCRPHMHEKHLTPQLQCGTDPRMIRAWSAHDPTTHETVSQPSHRRGRSSRFGNGLCMEKHRISCICYLSKTHFVRDFLQNSIGNSSSSTTRNAIYSEGTILLFLWLTVSLTKSFFD